MKILIKRVLNLFSNKKSNSNSQDFWIPVTKEEQNNPNRIVVEIPRIN
jgi:hypothetical protein